MERRIPDRPLTFFLFAYFHDNRWKQFVGASVKIWDLAHNLANVGHQVVLFLPRYGFKRQEAPFTIIEIPIIDLPGLRMASFNLFLFIRLFVSRFPTRPDVVYLRRTTTVIPKIYAKQTGARFFFEVNDDPYHLPETGADSWLSKLRNRISVRIDEWNLNAADRVFVISSEIARKIVNQNPRMPSDRLMLMPSGANMELFHPIEHNTAISAVSLDPSCPYVGFVGTLLAHQGLEILIEAAGQVLTKRPDCRFLIIGEGPMKEVWRDMAAAKGLGHAFIFTGQIPYQAVPYWINAMDICLAPYRSDAGLRSPVKIFDYLACGRPVIASDLAGTTDLFADTDAVVRIEPESPEILARAILGLLDDPASRARMGEEGRRWVANLYNRADMARTVSDEAANLLRRPGTEGDR